VVSLILEKKQAVQDTFRFIFT